MSGDLESHLDQAPTIAAQDLLARFPLILTVAIRNLSYDKLRLAISISGIAFAVFLVGVQLGLFFGSKKIITSPIDNTVVNLWVMPFDTESFEDGLPLLSNRERNQVLATPGVRAATPMVVYFADWVDSEDVITHVVVVGSKNPDHGLQPWNLVEGDWSAIRPIEAVAVDRTYLADLGISGIGERPEIESVGVRVRALTEGIRSFTQSPYVFVSLRYARKIRGLPNDAATYFVVNLEPQADIEKVQQALRDRLPDTDVLTTAEFRDRSLDRWLYRTGAGIAVIGGAILGAVIGIAIFGQTLYGFTREHLKGFATLRALGCRSTYLCNLVILQAIVVSLVGFLIGIGGVAGVTFFSKQTAMPLVVSSEVTALLLMTTVAIGAISALAVITKVLRIDPVTVFAEKKT